MDAECQTTIPTLYGEVKILLLINISNGSGLTFI